MVARLSLADATVNELAEPYEVSVQAVSKHLKVLEDSGLVTRTRDAQRRPVHLKTMCSIMTKWIWTISTPGRRTLPTPRRRSR
ncbi:ArsR/SmtB family transcription factor [Streptomyces canarius]